MRHGGVGGFGPPVAISQASPDLFHPRPSIDASGNATVVWVRDNGTHGIVQWAGYDADPPRWGGDLDPERGDGRRHDWRELRGVSDHRPADRDLVKRGRSAS